MYYISPMLFISQECFDWLADLNFIKEFNTPLHPDSISSRWYEAWRIFTFYLDYWREYRQDLEDYD